jgi:predicted MPP superfamily phosphohydrolase
MPRSFGIKGASAREQLQKRHEPRRDPEPLPEPYAPGVVEPRELGIKDPGDGISFFVLGDVGGIKQPGPQNAVSVAMERLLEGGQAAAFVLILGDVVYFNGQQVSEAEGRQTGYGDQFYEAYAKLARPIIAFPGNHDGEIELPQSEAPLQGFMENFCTKKAEAPKDDPELEFARHTQTLPYCEWTLALQAATIVSLYTNVPSGGRLEERQIDRLVAELRDAERGRKLILGLHHPPYSVDAHHGGSEHLGEILDEAFAKAGRAPDLILSGHVHDYQRFTRTLPDGAQIPYVVAGNGGYHNLHRFAKDATAGEELSPGVVFEHGDDRRYGFLKLTIADGEGRGEYIAVTPGQMPDGSEAAVFTGEDAFAF